MAAAITAAAIWYGLRFSRHTSSATVAALLPKETLAFVHLPDFNQTRADLQRTDLYQIWNEPAVREFLEKPRSHISDPDGFAHPLQELESLEVKDAFVALTSWEANQPKFAAGFRFKGSAEEAEKVIGRWRTKWEGATKPETTEYEHHQIETLTQGDHPIVTVYDGTWFLAGNDAATLQTILDRLDGRAKDRNATLAFDETFTGAFKHMPSSYAALLFARADRCLERIMPLAAKNPDGSTDQNGAIRQLHSFCAATSFEGGQIRDIVFAGMPRQGEAGKLTRASLSLGTKDTFLYAAGFLNLSNQAQFGGPSGALGWVGGHQKITEALSASGVTLDDWNTAFGPEFGLLGDWPSNSHWPAIFAALPVKDAAKASKILTSVTINGPDRAEWTQREKDGVNYFSTSSGGKFFSVSPTIALAERILVAGADPGSVEAAMKRSAQGASELASSKNFQAAEHALPPAKEAFAFVDPALLYARVDAVLRPMLFMSAVFLPGINDTVDLNKLPPAEIITKHLSPIAMSQRYDEDGYVAESIGPVTIYQAIAGLGGLASAATLFYRQQALTWSPGLAPTSGAPASPSATAMGASTPIQVSPTPAHTP
jgi:hypothetical protein